MRSWYNAPVILLAGTLIVVGKTTAGGPDELFLDGFESPPPGTKAWQLLYGRPSAGGVGSDKDGLIALDSDSSGNVYALLDRRFRDDRLGRPLILIEVDATGMLVDSRQLFFSSTVEPKDLRRFANGDFLIAIDDELIRIDASGGLVWEKTVRRDPFAFGRMNIRRVRLDEQENLYVAGDFNPSEPGPDRAFLAKLDSNGEGIWLRSWNVDTFEERVRLSVSGNGNAWVTSRAPEESDFDRAYSVYGFDASGNPLGQASFTHPGNLNIRIRHMDTVASDAGSLVVGIYAPRVDGEFQAFVFQAEMDNLGAISSVQQAGWVIDSFIQGVTRVSDPVRTTDGRIAAVIGADDSYAVLRIGPSDSSDRFLFAIQRGDGTSPYIDDDDHPVFVVPGENGTLRVGGTSEVPETVSPLALPVASIRADIAGAATNETIFSDILVIEDGAESFSVSDDTLGVSDDPEEGDEDTLLFSISSD